MVLQVFFAGALLVTLPGCSKEEQGTPADGNNGISVGTGVTENDFEKFEGALGMVVNTRNIARKGYMPHTALIDITSQNGEYSQTVTIDPVLSLAQLNIAIEGLNEEAVEELKNGVPVTISIRDEAGGLIVSQDFSAITFRDNPPATVLNVSSLEETPENLKIALKENTPYYIQKVSESGQPETKAARINRAVGFGNAVVISTNTEFAGVTNEPDFIFNFYPVPGEDNTFAIQLQSDQRFVAVGIFNVIGGGVAQPGLSGLTSFDAVQASSNYENFKFIIRKESEGAYSLVSKPTDEVIRETIGVGLTLGGGGSPIYFRIISNSLEWSAESLGTTFLQPILASPETSFGANSTLTNCGTGSLSQTIGADQAVTITNIVGWEERFAFTSSSTSSISTTVGTEFEAGFFGASANYSASVTASLETSASMTSESSSFGEFQETTSETIFFERTVTVPPGKASLVYDVAQIYNNTKVDFVQRFRLRAMENNSPLTGQELSSQLKFSRFNGVITQEGSDFIDITVKGTATLGKILEARSEVRDVRSNCD